MLVIFLFQNTVNCKKKISFTKQFLFIKVINYVIDIHKSNYKWNISFYEKISVNKNTPNRINKMLVPWFWCRKKGHALMLLHYRPIVLSQKLPSSVTWGEKMSITSVTWQRGARSLLDMLNRILTPGNREINTVLIFFYRNHRYHDSMEFGSVFLFWIFLWGGRVSTERLLFRNM